MTEELAEFNLFMGLLMSGCVVNRCDDGVYICQRPQGAIDPGDTPCFAISQGEVAAHVRSMTTDQETPSSSEDEPSSNDSTSSSSPSSSGDDDSDDTAAKVVVNVNSRRKRRRHRH